MWIKMKNEILLYCMGIRKKEIKTDELTDSDWDDIIQQSMMHGVSALLYRNIKVNKLDSFVPATVMQRLRSAYLYNTMKNLRMYNEFSKIFKALNENNIPFIVVKGAALAELIYKDIALRPMADLDLIVKTEDIWNTDQIFSDLGYKSDIKYFVSKHHAQWANNIHYLKNIPVDIHPVIYNLPNIDPWIKARRAKVNSDEVMVLGPEDFLLHLCLHLNTHFYMKNIRLIWWCDIVELLRSYHDSFDWDYFVSITKRAQSETSLHKILKAIKSENADIIIPDSVFNQLKSDGTSISIDDILALSNDPECKRGNIRPGDLHLRQTMLFILKIPSIRNKVKLAFRIIFPQKDFLISHYMLSKPDKAIFYYPIHIFNVIVNALRSLSYIPGYIKDKQSFLDKLENLGNFQQVL